MQVAKVLISENRATVQDLKMITSGTVGATVAFEFDETWDGWTRGYMFRVGFKVVGDEQKTGVIPAELIKKPGVRLEAGVFGTKGDLQLPTIWADLGVVRTGVNPSGDPSTNPRLPVWAQLQQGMEATEQNVEELQAGLNETEQSIQALQNGQIVCSASGEVVTVHDASDHALKGLTLYGKTTQDGTPTPDAPIDLESVGGGGSVGVTVCGKNALPMWDDLSVFTGAGLSATKDADGAIVLSGTTTKDLSAFAPAKYLSAGTYTISNIDAMTEGMWLSVSNNPYFMLGTNADPLKHTTTIADMENAHLYLFVQSGRTLSNFRLLPQVERGSNATAYEPYVSCGALTAQTPNGLPGIPVSSGGNYTDANGQQWICDEIDFARGVYVQRVLGTQLTEFIASSISSAPYRFRTDHLEHKIKPLIGLCNITTHSGTPWGTGAGFSTNVETTGHGIMYINLPDKFTTVDEINTYAAENPIVVLAALETPIETPLSAEEIAAFKALHTNKPNTTVYTDSNAGIKLDYVADTKTYIDNKFAELAAAIVSNT